MEKKCDHCKKYKDEEEFNWRFKSLGVRAKTCRECAHEHNKKYFEGDAKQRHLQQVQERKYAARLVARDYVYEYLENHPCSKCGENDPRVLEFHHEHGKEYPISVMVNGGYPTHKIQAEIDKCIVLCSNCHRKLTMDERGWWKGNR